MIALPVFYLIYCGFKIFIASYIKIYMQRFLSKLERKLGNFLNLICVEVGLNKERGLFKILA